jgi:hypothetical protein
MKKILFLSILTVLVLTACNANSVVIGPEEAKAKALEFINTTLMQGGQAEITEVVDKEDFYELKVKLSADNEITSGLTKDGKKFFSYVMDIEEETNKASETTAQSNQTATVADVEKSDRPKVELFVMSHCPYGTQIEKGILPVLDEIGSDIDFELKFCDYAMHGKVELDEQMNQVCIQENEPEKLTTYLECFLAEANAGEKCLTETGINQTQLNSCVADLDKEYKVSELFADQSTWKSGRFPQFNVFQADNQAYGVGGSPSFVLNGKKIQTGRDSDSLLRTICSAFNNAPAGCSAELSAATPAPGFGSGTAAGATDAGCGS